MLVLAAVMAVVKVDGATNILVTGQDVVISIHENLSVL
jgi:hypothetical protein